MLLKRLKWTPHNYQKKCIKFGLENPIAAFFLDPGLGKTTIMLAIIKMLLKMGVIDSVLLIAPLRIVHSVWSPENKHSEVNKWKDFLNLKINILHGRYKEDLLYEDADIYVINPEGLSLFTELKPLNLKCKTCKGTGKTKSGACKRCKGKGRQTRAKTYTLIPNIPLPFDMLVVDESTIFKHDNTQQFRRLKALLPSFKRRYILTGTPAPNGLMDLFGQIYILDGGRALGAYITHYRNKYFDDSYDGFGYDLKDGADKDITAAIKQYVIRLSAEDYLKLPPKIPRIIYIDLPKKARDIYNELEEELIVEMDQGLILAKNAGIVSNKCRQIANGGVYLTPDLLDSEGSRKLAKIARQKAELHTAKIEALRDLLDELSGQPTIIAYEFDHDLARLKKALGQDTPHIGGGVSHKRAQQIETDWNAGKIPYLLGQPGSISRGYNLQGTGRAVILFSLFFNLEHYDQLIKRVWRQGQKQRVFIYHIAARNTVDEAVLKSLEHKNQTQTQLLRELKTYLNIRKAA